MSSFRGYLLIIYSYVNKINLFKIIVSALNWRTFNGTYCTPLKQSFDTFSTHEKSAKRKLQANPAIFSDP